MIQLRLKSSCHYLLGFIFRCMNALVLSLTPSISPNEPFLIKDFSWTAANENE